MAEEVLSDIRNRIDALDDQVLALLSERAALAMDVAKRKIAAGESGSFYRADREADVLKRIRKNNKGPLSDDTVMRLFREVMSACLALEKPLQIAYLGPEGTYSQLAALKHFGHSAETISAASISEVFRAVAQERCQYGVVPVENSTEGVVSHTLDEFIDSALLICGEVVLRIEHNLLGSTTDITEIEEVLAHQQSLAQCRKWLQQNLPNAALKAVSSNGEAARLVMEQPGRAAIASDAAARCYGLHVLRPQIEDGAENTTRFYVIGKQRVGQTNADKTTLMVATGNHPGALYRVLEPFARLGISMTKIESRPSRQGNWNYVFFIEIEGHQSDNGVAEAIAALDKDVVNCKVLGSYPKALL